MTANCDSLASAFGRQSLVWRDGRDNFGGGALYEFEALKQHSGVAIPQQDVIRARRSGLKADCLANHKRHSLSFRFADALRCACAALGAVKVEDAAIGSWSFALLLIGLCYGVPVDRDSRERVESLYFRFLGEDMRKILLAVALTLTLATNFLAATKHNFEKETLINVTSDEILDEGTTYRWAIVTVQIGDLVYTARGGRIRRHSGDPAQGLIVGDTIQVAIDGDDLILLKSGGKELKAKITKRARAQ